MQNQYKKIIFTLSVTLLFACGGGGGEIGKSVQSENPIIIAQTELLSSEPIELPSIMDYLNNLCGNNTNIQDILIEDINGDGKKDLVFNLWCNTKINGEINNGPTPNNIVIFLQNKFGNFDNSTEYLLGKKYFDMGGHGFEVISHDFNKDGINDFVWSVNREDGRNTDYPATDANAQNSFFMSNGDKFNHQKLGQTAWNYNVNLVDNSMGSKDLISTPIGYNGVTEGWRYTNGWQLINDYNWVIGKPLFFKSTDPKIGSELAISGNSTTKGIDAYYKSNSQWSKTDTFLIGQKIGVAKIKAWNLNISETPITLFNNKKFIYFAISDLMCELSKKDNQASMIAAAWGYELPSSYNGEMINEWDLKFYNKILPFNIINGKISENNKITIKNELNNIFGTKISCEDINGDGLIDIMIHQWTANHKIALYLNDGNGSFSLVDNKLFPIPNQFKKGIFQKYQDIDGDGIPDLLVTPTVGLNVDEKPIFYLYKGKRKLTLKDIQ